MTKKIQHQRVLKFFLTLLLLTTYDVLKAQNEKIEDYAKGFSGDKNESIETFAQALVKSYTTEYDKALVIYAWVATHIRYDNKKLENLVENNFKTAIKSTSKEEAQRKNREMKEAATLQCFKSKKGVCEDYSHLYKKMCDAVGVECVVIEGTAKMLTQRTKGMNHAWNAVKIDSKWHLLDVTWGAGNTEDETFVPRYSAGFFAVEPRFFILNHLPNDDTWQFLEKPLTKEEFKKQPWVNYGQKIAPIKDVQPLESALKIEDGKATIKIQFTKPVSGLKLFTPGHKLISHTETPKDGYVLLTFEVSAFPFVYLDILVAENDRKTQTLAKFYIEQL